MEWAFWVACVSGHGCVFVGCSGVSLRALVRLLWHAVSYIPQASLVLSPHYLTNIRQVCGLLLQVVWLFLIV